MTRVLALVATIPPRRASCERLLRELAQQSRPPDGVIVCPDGYPGADLLKAYRGSWMRLAAMATCGGPGHKWRAACDLAPDDILISIDDDADLGQAPRFIESLARAVEQHGAAAAAMGYTPGGHRAGPGDVSRGRLILGCGCGLALRAGHLDGLQALADEVKAAGGPDALGPLGDDQALVSAHLWKQGVPIWHAATGPLFYAPGTQRDSQDKQRAARGEVTRFEQAHRIAQITGWPFPKELVVDVAAQGPALEWEAVLSAVPQGAVKAQGTAPAPGWQRVLVQDGEEPERSGVYDVPPPLPG